MTTADTLASWTVGAARVAVVDFVRTVSEPGDSFVAPPERIATFDNDGTLWCEKLRGLRPLICSRSDAT